ncbi:1144_t:CDS:2 [Funneliformis geosporum]|nr:1144_t:CDS:2 [Funneliformis geosporum]
MLLVISVQKRDKSYENYQSTKLLRTFQRILKNRINLINQSLLISEIEKQLFPNISTQQINEILILTVTSFIEKDPVYDDLAAGLLLQKLYREVFPQKFQTNDFQEIYQKTFAKNLRETVMLGITNPRLSEFDLEKLGQFLVPQRDNLFKYLGLETLYNNFRYFLRKDKQILETPQAFWMRVAMGLALNEKNKEERAIEFYQVMSNLRFISSTPTLLHSGLKRAQLSSCFLTTINDDLNHIFKSYQDSANLLKYSGGVANDWSNIRATGSLIKSINSETTGLVPFLKISNDVTHAINRSGKSKRKGATVAYLEVWHLEIEDFLDLRRNTGDERRRTHDLNLAAWVPDLFMKRDSCNIRSPQDHMGVVHCSNLCTEITLNTSESETAVCNLGSVNLSKHINEGKLDEKLFQQTITTAMRMLDNVIDLNYYPTAETKNSNLKHRPVGLGMMGFQDALFQLNLAYNSPETLKFTDEITEKYSYYAISSSSQLAKERGTYSSYQEKERGEKIEVERKERMDWNELRRQVRQNGMRNSNTMAIAPTATISNIAGCYPCIEAMYSNLYVKSNIAGEFETLEWLKYYNGSIQSIPYISQELKTKYKGVFELDPE